MAKPKKSTRKFEKNHLKDTIERRKGLTKVKQRQQIRDKKKARRSQDLIANGDNGEHESGTVGKETNGDAANFEDMDVDQFFQGGFDIAEKSPKKRGRNAVNEPEKSKPALKRTRDEAEVEVNGGVEEEDVQVDEDTISSEDEVDTLSSAELGSASGDDDIDAHKRDLDALAEKDPEFYKYLKENDAKLLNVDEGRNPPELEESSGSEAQGPSQTRRGKVGDEQEDAPSEDDQGLNDGQVVTMTMLSKWRKALLELHSLRALRDVMSAFKAAAHINDMDGKAYKYTISSADGIVS